MLPTTEALRRFSNSYLPSVQSLADVQSFDDAAVAVARILALPPGSPERVAALRVINSVLTRDREVGSQYVGFFTAPSVGPCSFANVEDLRYATPKYWAKLMKATVKTLAKNPNLVVSVFSTITATPADDHTHCAVTYSREGLVIADCASCPFVCPVAIVTGRKNY